jgi:pSer/pThr/pTyr-binding forkhead associated (FHA) protein
MVNLSAYLLLALRLLMALTLYAFLGWALYTLWRDLRSESKSLESQRIPPIALALQDVEDPETTRFSAPEITIGRHPRCEWVLGHETVSSRHARLIYHHEQWWLEDLSSRNGTFLNGEAVTAPVVLAHEDAVRCGQIAFTVWLDPVQPGIGG